MIWILSSPGHKNVSQTMIHRLYYVVTVVRVIIIEYLYFRTTIILILSGSGARVL